MSTNRPENDTLFEWRSHQVIRNHRRGVVDQLDRPRWILPAIVIGQALVTSTWFAPNAVIGSLQPLWPEQAGVGAVTIAVQLGFIAGTLVYGLGGVADRFAARYVFGASAGLAAACNAAVLVTPANFEAVVGWRFLTGFWLAGVYPVGMKIAASWYPAGLGRALGYLVGALVLGTALPHAARAWQSSSDWQHVLIASTVAALVGGALVLLVPEGPALRRGGPIHFTAVLRAFAVPQFRDAALGYYGHMWEVYAFWAFVPTYIAAAGFDERTVSMISFAVIAAGALGCVVGGWLAARWGSDRVAFVNLSISGLACMLSPLGLRAAGFDVPAIVTVALLLVWGAAVAADSPQLSTLNALTAPRDVVGSALTLSNCIGFAVTIVSITLLGRLLPLLGARWLFVPLALGPAFGVWRLRRLIRATQPR